MKILITGANGFLGRRLTAHYEKTHEVFAARRADMDITSPSSVMSLFEDFRPEIVLHCAAMSDVKECAASPGRSQLVNVFGTENIARACARRNTKMVFASSDQVYLRARRQEGEAAFLRPHSEGESLSPLPLYGQHKLCAEQACQTLLPGAVILRLSLMYGDPNEEERERNRGTFGVQIADALRRGRPLAYSRHEHRGVTNVREVVLQMEKAWELPGGVYNFGSPTNQSMYDAVLSVLRRFGQEALAVPLEGDERNLSMSSAKLNAANLRFLDAAEALTSFIAEHMA